MRNKIKSNNDLELPKTSSKKTFFTESQCKIIYHLKLPKLNISNQPIKRTSSITLCVYY